LNKNQNWVVFFVALILLINGVFIKALADDDDHEEKKWYKKIFGRDDDDDDDNDHNRGKKRRRYQKRDRNDSKHNGKHYLTPVNNPTYIEECGDCHFAYQPELLPSGSWEKIRLSKIEWCRKFLGKTGCQDHAKFGKQNTAKNNPDPVYSTKAP